MTAGSGKASKRGSVIGANTFIGPHTTLQPGVAIGHECFIGSFSTVRDDVANGTFVETVHEVRVRRNKVRLPKRKKVSNFYLGVAPTTHRRSAGVLLIDQRGRFILQRRDAHSNSEARRFGNDFVSTFYSLC